MFHSGHDLGCAFLTEHPKDLVPAEDEAPIEPYITERGQNDGYLAALERGEVSLLVHAYDVCDPGERCLDMGSTGSWDEIVGDLQDTNEIYTRFNDELSGRQLLAGRLNMLFRDRRAHARTARLMETEARMSREAWDDLWMRVILVCRGYVATYHIVSLAVTDQRVIVSRLYETNGDYRDAGGRSQEAEAAHRGTEADKETSDSDGRVRETARTRQRSCTARATGGGW
ncbi:hypothetical protein Tco_0425305 [Tanacetum coccineum]